MNHRQPHHKAPLLHHMILAMVQQWCTARLGNRYDINQVGKMSCSFGKLCNCACSKGRFIRWMMHWESTPNIKRLCSSPPSTTAAAGVLSLKRVKHQIKHHLDQMAELGRTIKSAVWRIYRDCQLLCQLPRGSLFPSRIL